MNYILSLCSDFIYAISLPDKEGYPQYDLSEDIDIELDPSFVKSLTPMQLAVERVIAKTFKTYHVDVVVTDRLRALFNSKLWRMGNLLQSLGGLGRENLLLKWKSTWWKLELTKDETANNHVIAAATTKRCTVLHEKLKESGKQFKETTNQLKILEESTVRLSNALRPVSANGQLKRKAWVDCTTQYKNQQKKKCQKCP